MKKEQATALFFIDSDSVNRYIEEKKMKCWF